jgi:hypothetical protein
MENWDIVYKVTGLTNDDLAKLEKYRTPHKNRLKKYVWNNNSYTIPNEDNPDKPLMLGQSSYYLTYLLRTYIQPGLSKNFILGKGLKGRATEGDDDKIEQQAPEIQSAYRELGDDSWLLVFDHNYGRGVTAEDCKKYLSDALK